MYNFLDGRLKNELGHEVFRNLSQLSDHNVRFNSFDGVFLGYEPFSDKNVFFYGKASKSYHVRDLGIKTKREMISERGYLFS